MKVTLSGGEFGAAVVEWDAAVTQISVSGTVEEPIVESPPVKGHPAYDISIHTDDPLRADYIGIAK